MGTAVLLGTWSYAYWLAQTKAQKVADVSQKSPYAQLFWIGFLLILLGLIFTSTRWWETAVWLLFTGWALFNLIASLRSAK